MADLISKATRTAFREHLVGWTLREIEILFSNEDFAPIAEAAANVVGARRSYVEQHYAGINFADQGQAKRLTRVFSEICDVLERRAANESDQSVRSQIQQGLDGLTSKMKRDGYDWVDRQFIRTPAAPVTLQMRALELTEASVLEHVEKARAKIATGDHSGAITSAYTLVESLLKALLREIAPGFKETQGDIRALYGALKGPMNLDAGGDNIEAAFKPILTGLQSQVAGLFELANKASDRHARRYNPAPHHAKLAVNCAFTLCEFLLESYEHQKSLAHGKKAS